VVYVVLSMVVSEDSSSYNGNADISSITLIDDIHYNNIS
jgi:hypothetical protein